MKPEFNDAFWCWFGDSKVKKQGVPTVVYHGTGATNVEKFNTHEVWFSEDPNLASAYSGAKSWKKDQLPTIYPVYLSIQNPLKLSVNMNDKMTRRALSLVVGFNWALPKYEDDFVDGVEQIDKVHRYVRSFEFREAAIHNGYDGIRVKEGKSVTWAAFYPEQIKSATGNDGTWDSDDPDIGSNPEPSERTYYEIGHRGLKSKLWYGDEFNINVEPAEFDTDAKDVDPRNLHNEWALRMPWHGRYDPYSGEVSIMGGTMTEEWRQPSEQMLDRLRETFGADVKIVQFNPLEKESDECRPIRLWRAADDDHISDSASFSEDRAAAEAYLFNRGFGGKILYYSDVCPVNVLDLTKGEPIERLMHVLDSDTDWGAIGADELVPRLAFKLRDKGYQWVKVHESYPVNTITWIYVGGPFGDEPEMMEWATREDNPRRRGSLSIPVIHPGCDVQVIEDYRDARGGLHARWKTIDTCFDTPKSIGDVFRKHGLQSAWIRDAIGGRRMVTWKDLI